VEEGMTNNWVMIHSGNVLLDRDLYQCLICCFVAAKPVDGVDDQWWHKKLQNVSILLKVCTVQLKFWFRRRAYVILFFLLVIYSLFSF
jgi:hypothetical protein